MWNHQYLQVSAARDQRRERVIALCCGWTLLFSRTLFSLPFSLQALNEINSMTADPHIWTHDGDQAEIYGLAPNYGVL